MNVCKVSDRMNDVMFQTHGHAQEHKGNNKVDLTAKLQGSLFFLSVNIGLKTLRVCLFVPNCKLLLSETLKTEILQSMVLDGSRAV